MITSQLSDILTQIEKRNGLFQNLGRNFHKISKTGNMILLDELFHSFLISSETFLPSCLCRRYISNIIIIDILIILNSEVVKYSINKRSQPSLASSHQSTVSWLCKFTEIHFGDP